MDGEINKALIVIFLVLLPAGLLVHQFLHRSHPVINWVAALFAHIWQFQWRLILFAAGVQWQLWEFAPSDIQLFGVPTFIMFGASLLLGMLPRIFFTKLPPLVLTAALLVFDLVLILVVFPLSFPAISLLWLGLTSLLVIVPSTLLAEWTVKSKHVYLRSFLQNISWGILLLWLFPSLIFNNTNDGWQSLVSQFLERNVFGNTLYFLPMLIPALLIINALYVFAKQGQGTGFPYDAPRYLVTTGVYRYISNPMQVGIVMMMAIWGWMLQSYLVALSAVVALTLFLVFRNVCNGSCQLGITDPEWEKYQANTAKWLPLNFNSQK
jgi:protein-S-isoprenylcysteine O-methyltransferase Ste14